MTVSIELVGYLGGLLIAITLAPQLIKTWRRKSAEDLSLLWTSITLTGLILYGIYTAINTVLPLFTFATIEAIIVTTLIVLKIRYDRMTG